MDSTFYWRAFLAPGVDDGDEQLINASHPENKRRYQKLVRIALALRSRGMYIAPGRWPCEFIYYDPATGNECATVSVMGRDYATVFDDDRRSSIREVAFEEHAIAAELYRSRRTRRVTVA